MTDVPPPDVFRYPSKEKVLAALVARVEVVVPDEEPPRTAQENLIQMLLRKEMAKTGSYKRDPERMIIYARQLHALSNRELWQELKRDTVVPLRQ